MSHAWFAQRSGLMLTTLAAAAAGAFLFRLLHLPLAYILGSLVGATLVANLIGPMRGGRHLRRVSQLFVGASVGVLLDGGVIEALVRLFPLMLVIAVAGSLLGLVLAVPIAWLSGIDRLSGLLSCLPAGMAEMATLAHEVNADEQSVAIIHTLRVIVVLTLVPLWLVVTGHPVTPVRMLLEADAVRLITLGALIVASLLLAVIATRLRVINAFIVTPTLVAVLFVALGFEVPAVPQPLLIAAQIGIGTSLGLRFRFDRMRRLPRTVAGGLISGLILVSLSIFGLGTIIERLTDLDHLSSLLAAAPGGLGEMIATANALGVAAAAVAGFQLTRSIFTNVIVAPLIRRHVLRRRPDGLPPSS
ncbi:AbrB family transcriptional regulator [Mangrovicella endophytica]|uniref:AbrB family transcriptional regulator n=1 Tax=Mangrovicella endophytica TaxID=2066697 RepID=UPI002477D60B|nr:AbrB family transcriptional regulator [Mangrovicella endophytica]